MNTLSVTSEVFTRGVEEVITREELAGLLKSKKQLRVKLGIDATAPYLHIGHAVNLWKIRVLQEAGHKAVIILGGITTQIGDPTGKTAARPVLAEAEIRKNIAALKKQIAKILLTSPRVYELRNNLEWFGKMKTAEFLRLTAMVTHARLIERDMFQERIKEGKEITISELLYPILQGYDSVAIKNDMTIIGSDQLFNEHMGRLMQERHGQRPQVIVTNKILPGLGGGEKMSKSLGNYIALEDSPKDKFGKAMRVLDELIIPYLEVYTSVPMVEIEHVKEELEQGKNPMEAKLFLAESLVSRYHGAKIARKEREEFSNVFSKGTLPEDMPEAAVETGERDLIDLLCETKLAPSRSEARRFIMQGAVEIDGRSIGKSEKTISVNHGSIIRVGRRRFVKIK